MRLKTMLAATAAIAVVVSSVGMAQAGTVTTHTITKQKDINAYKVNFSAFDINNDGILSKQEVGTRLFESFDGDHNGQIDNLEIKQKNVLTIIPMETETLHLVDYDNDGMTDRSSLSYNDFIVQSGLARFDGDGDGLSAEEFLNGNFQELDLNDNNMIDMQEWKRAYASIYLPRHQMAQTYND